MKAALAMTASVPAPREILVAGRLAGAPGLLDALTERLASVATVRPPPGWARAPRRQRKARRCSRTDWPGGATHRSSSGCA